MEWLEKDGVSVTTSPSLIIRGTAKSLHVGLGRFLPNNIYSAARAARTARAHMTPIMLVDTFVLELASMSSSAVNVNVVVTVVVIVVVIVEVTVA